jgi:DNA-directed RNA polymerase subunit beta
VDLGEFSDEEILKLCENLRKGVPMATPVFDGAEEDEIKAMLRWRICPRPGRRRSLTGAPATPSTVP